jgi:hypothetical protein
VADSLAVGRPLVRFVEIRTAAAQQRVERVALGRRQVCEHQLLDEREVATAGLGQLASLLGEADLHDASGPGVCLALDQTGAFKPAEDAVERLRADEAAPGKFRSPKRAHVVQHPQQRVLRQRHPAASHLELEPPMKHVLRLLHGQGKAVLAREGDLFRSVSHVVGQSYA